MKAGKIIFTAALFIMMTAALAAQTTTVQSFIAQADRLATVEFKNQEALNVLKEAEKMDKNNFEILWRISRSLIDIGEHLPAKTDDEKDRQLKMYEESLDYANRAVNAKPNDAEGYVRRAIAYGRVALFKGVWESKDIVKKVKADCEKALTIDPKNATAHYVFARSHAKLAEKPKVFRWPLGLDWGNRDDAAKMYEQAIALRPDFIMYRLDAGKNYIEMSNYGKAREHLTLIASLPKQDEDDDAYRGEARDLLNSIKGK